MGRYILGISIFVFWLVLVGRMSGPELVLGIFAALSSVLLARASQEQRFGATAIPPSRLVKLPFSLLTDTARIFGELIATAGRRARFRLVRFDAGQDDPPSATRRALALTAASFLPNTVAIGIDRDTDRMLVHEMVPDEGEVLP